MTGRKAIKASGNSRWLAATEVSADPGQLLAGFSNASTVGLAICDDQLRFRAINNTLAAMNGIPAGAHLGRTVREILGKSAAPIESIFQRVLATGQPVLGVEIATKLPTRTEVGYWVEDFFPIRDEAGRVKQVSAMVVEITKQKRLEYLPRNLMSKVPRTTDDEQHRLSGFEEEPVKECIANTSIDKTVWSPLKLSPGVSSSLLFRFLLVSRIYRRRMALFCQKNYGLEPSLLLILTAASEGHLQQGILARSLGINKNAMVFLIDKLELLRLIKRVANPDNRRERLIECTLKGRDIIAGIKTNYPEIVRWGLYPLNDAQIDQFGTLLVRILEGNAGTTPPVPLVRAKKTKRINTPNPSP